MLLSTLLDETGIHKKKTFQKRACYDPIMEENSSVWSNAVQDNCQRYLRGERKFFYSKLAVVIHKGGHTEQSFATAYTS